MADTACVTQEIPTHYATCYARIEKNDTADNGPDVVATVTCDSIDADNEVVLPSGADLSRFVKAPRIMLCHAYGKPGEYYPMPVGKALWTRRDGNAIKQGIRFARASEMGREVAGLFKEDMLNTFSIGFQSLEGGPPTKDEIRAHPEWANVSYVHRRWLLLETSVVPIPSNPDAIGQWVGKGHRLPEFLAAPRTRKGKPMAEEITAGADDIATATATATAAAADPENKAKKPEPADKPEEVDDDLEPDPEADKAYKEFADDLKAKHKTILHSGKAGHLYAHPDEMKAHYVRHADDDDLEKGYHSEAQVKAMLGCAKGCKGVTVSEDHPDEAKGFERLHPPVEPHQKEMGESSGTAGGYLVGGEHAERFDPDHDNDDDSTPEGDRDHDYFPKPGHFVKWDDHVGMHKGVGRVVSVHKSGKVPDVANEVHADEANPHAKIKVFKARSDPHVYHETDHHVGVHVNHLKAMDMIAKFGDEKTAGSEYIMSDEHGVNYKFVDSLPVSKAVVPYKAGPVVEGAWDAGAARARLKSRANGDMSKYEEGFAYCDSAKKEDYGSYKFPHHDVRGGKLVVVKEGVIAALAAIDGARGGTDIPEGDRAGVKAHLEKHRAEFAKEKPEKRAPVRDAEPPATREPQSIPPFRTTYQVEAELQRKLTEDARVGKADADAIATQAIERLLGGV